MFNYLRNKLPRTAKVKIRKNDPRLIFLESILTNTHNNWILDDMKLARVFQMFFEALSINAINFFLSQNRSLIFSRASGKLSCAIPNIDKCDVIVIFPDLYQLLKSASPDHGVAILLHEVGHIIHDHSNKNISSLEAQLEADRFAFNHGHGDQLANILEEYNQFDECKRRIEQLNILKSSK